MALSLGVSRGDKLDIGDHMVTILEIPHTQRLHLSCGDRTYEITDCERVQVLPQVYISIGKAARVVPQANPREARLAIEAPREIAITRRQ